MTIGLGWMKCLIIITTYPLPIFKQNTLYLRQTGTSSYEYLFRLHVESLKAFMTRNANEHWIATVCFTIAIFKASCELDFSNNFVAQPRILGKKNGMNRFNTECSCLVEYFIPPQKTLTA